MVCVGWKLCFVERIPSHTHAYALRVDNACTYHTLTNDVYIIGKPVGLRDSSRSLLPPRCRETSAGGGYDGGRLDGAGALGGGSGGGGVGMEPPLTPRTANSLANSISQGMDGAWCSRKCTNVCTLTCARTQDKSVFLKL